MAKIKNISSLGDLIIPALGNLVVKAGESADVSDEAAASLLAQPDNWEAADRAASSLTSTSPADSIPAASN
jgi:hypothetical protein